MVLRDSRRLAFVGISPGRGEDGSETNNPVQSDNMVVSGACGWFASGQLDYSLLAVAPDADGAFMEILLVRDED